MRLINKVFITTIYLMIIYPLDLLFSLTTVGNNALYIIDIPKNVFLKIVSLFLQ